MPEHELHLIKKHFALLLETIRTTREPEQFIARVEDALEILHALDPTSKFVFLTREQRRLLARIEGDLLPAARALRDECAARSTLRHRNRARILTLRQLHCTLYHTGLERLALDEISAAAS